MIKLIFIRNYISEHPKIDYSWRKSWLKMKSHYEGNKRTYKGCLKSYVWFGGGGDSIIMLCELPVEVQWLTLLPNNLISVFIGSSEPGPPCSMRSSHRGRSLRNQLHFSWLLRHWFLFNSPGVSIFLFIFWFYNQKDFQLLWHRGDEYFLELLSSSSNRDKWTWMTKEFGLWRSSDCILRGCSKFCHIEESSSFRSFRCFVLVVWYFIIYLENQ